MPRFVATLRAIYDAKDDVEAIYIADQIRLNGAKDLDDEEDDVLDVTQVTSNEIDLSPEETIVQLKRARNLLIRTRIKQCYHLARELDIQIYALQHRLEPDFTMGGYNYGDFMDLTEAILVRGEQPDV